MMVDCPAWVPAWVSAAEPVPDAILEITEGDWLPRGAAEWLGCDLGRAELAEIITVTGGVQVRDPLDEENGRRALAVPVRGGYLVQIREYAAGPVEQVGERGAQPIGTRMRTAAAIEWGRPAYLGNGWVIPSAARAAEIAGQWVGAAALPNGVTTAFLDPEPAA